MKKTIILILLFLGLLYENTFAQTYTTPLYIIFDIDTPPMTRDIRKYAMWRGETQPVMRTHTLRHTYPDIYYFGLPLFGKGGILYFTKERNAVTTEIPLSEVTIQYPQAKTILQVEQEVMPLIEYDFNNPNPNFSYYKTYKYFSQSRPIYVIELDKPNNRAIIVPVVAPNPR